MFETSLNGEYLAAHEMGLTPAELLRVAEAGFRHAFLPEPERLALLHAFHSRAATLGLV
jgi:adenosine deaminase